MSSESSLSVSWLLIEDSSLAFWRSQQQRRTVSGVPYHLPLRKSGSILRYAWRLIRHRICVAPTARANIPLDQFACARRNEQRTRCAHRNAFRAVLILNLCLCQFSGFSLLRNCRGWPSCNATQETDKFPSPHRRSLGLAAGQIGRLEVAGNVRFGSLAAIEGPSPDVRFTPESRHQLAELRCPL
jgi:hypothetical protein